MLGDILLPPGYRVDISLSGEQPPLNARITAYRDDEWVGEVTASTSRLDVPGELQKVVDFLTKRGIRISPKKT